MGVGAGRDAGRFLDIAMDEYIEIRFFKNARRLKVKRRVPDGIEFDEPDALERTLGLGFLHRNEATRLRMDNIRRIQGWRPGQFDLSMRVEDGSIILRGVNDHALPEGFYKLRVQIEEVRSTGGWHNVNLDHDSGATVDVDVEMDDRSVDVDLTGCDSDIQAVLDRSTIDGTGALAWLEDPTRRPTRQACLLNLLASLRARPTTSDPLLALVDHFFWVANDRVYARVDKAFLETMKDLANNSDRFYEEGTPHSAVHQKLFARIDESPDVIAQFQGLCSFRGEQAAGKPSLQTVVAVAPANLPYTYAEFDLDVGNPLQDILGFFVHMGELLDGKSTNHLDLRSKLMGTAAERFIYYKIT
jgi:hypothetical protein